MTTATKGTDSTYLKFALETLKYDSPQPQRYGYDWFCAALDHVQQDKPQLVDWVGFETCLRDILSSSKLNDAQRVDHCRTAVAAFTRRGSCYAREEQS